MTALIFTRVEPDPENKVVLVHCRDAKGGEWFTPVPESEWAKVTIAAAEPPKESEG